MALTSGAADRLKNYNKSKLIIGVRPETILLTDQVDATFSAQCLVAEPQGSHQVVAFELGDKIVKVIAPTIPKINPGEGIHLTFKAESMRFFDPETTLAITNA
jgi:multiple sugar transport system ATP-binding protein